MKLTLTLLSILILSGCTLRQAQVSFIGANVCDYTSTVTGGDNFHEANPILTDNPYIQASIMGGLGAYSLWATDRLYKSGKKKTAIIILIAGAGVHGWACYHNVNLGD